MCFKYREMQDNDKHKIHNSDYFGVVLDKTGEGYTGDIKQVDNLSFLNWLIGIWVFIILHFVSFSIG